MINKIGLAFVGGGGKGAYQIGVWRALHETGIAQQVKAVAGTSVGGLNAALFAQGDIGKAFQTWTNISYSSVLKPHTPSNGIFSNENLAKMIRESVDLSWDKARKDVKCYITAASIDDKAESVITNEEKNIPLNEVNARYFDISDTSLTEKTRLEILLATAALPKIFPKQKIGDERFEDGGTADNVPVRPLHDFEKCDLIIVIHLNATYGSLDIIVDKNRFPDSTVIEIWPQQNQHGLRGTLDFNSENAKKRIADGYNENILYFRKLADSLKKGTIPENISYNNLLNEFNKKIERHKADDDKLITHTLTIAYDILSSVTSDISCIRSHLQRNRYDAGINRYMMICGKKRDKNYVPYVKLSNGDRILNAVLDLYEICGSYDIPDIAEAEVIAEKLELPQEINTAELLNSISDDMMASFKNTVSSYQNHIEQTGIYTKAICDMTYDQNTDVPDTNVNTANLILDMISDLQSMKLCLEEEKKDEAKLDKSFFREDTVFAEYKINSEYSKNYLSGKSRTSDKISEECLDYIERICTQFYNTHKYNSKDGGIQQDRWIAEQLEIPKDKDIFLMHLDSSHYKKRGFVITCDGISAFVKSEPLKRSDTSFADLADITEFINYSSANIIDKANKRTRIKGIKKDSEELEILPKKYIHSADIIPLLEKIRNACWVDLYL